MTYEDANETVNLRSYLLKYLRKWVLMSPVRYRPVYLEKEYTDVSCENYAFLRNCSWQVNLDTERYCEYCVAGDSVPPILLPRQNTRK